MFYHFQPFYQSFEQGSGRVNRWRKCRADDVQIRAKFLMKMDVAKRMSRNPEHLRFAFRDICRNTDERTFVNSIIPAFPAGNTVPSLTPIGQVGLGPLLQLAGVCATLTCDYLARFRTSGAHINQFILKDIQIPWSPGAGSVAEARLEVGTARLTFIHRRFAPEWLRLRVLYPSLGEREWKFNWAVTEADRLRLRVEVEALTAGLYGLSPDDFDWIVRDDPTDPKGFYRVDRNLPFRERLTGLAAAAFRALKDGKWSAESAAKLSNDEFFALLGIPELTSDSAARAAHLPEPLIRKRPGCHAWEPEKFLESDSRHGWTWDHCRADAVAVLGTEEAVQAYLTGSLIPGVSEGVGRGPLMPSDQLRLF